MSGRVVYPDLYIPPGVDPQAADVAAAVGCSVEQAQAELERARARAGLVAGVCRGCGCTEARACPGGCAWVDEDRTLCTTCATRHLARQGGRLVGELVGDQAESWLRGTFGQTLGGVMVDVARALVRGQGTKSQRPARKRVKAAIPSRKRPGGSRR